MRFCLRAVAVLMAVAVALPVVIGQPPGSGQPTPGGPAASLPAKPQLAVKVFRLERGDPEAVTSALAMLLESSNAEVSPPVPVGGPPGVGAPGGFGGGPPGGFGGVPPGTPLGAMDGFGGQPGGFGGAGPGAAGRMLGIGGMPAGGAGVIGCFIGDGGPRPIPVWRAALQPRIRAVVVRGSDRHLKVAADLVAILDRPANAPLPKLQVVKAFALKHATAEELSEVIEALSFGDAKVATPDERVLALIAPDEVVKSVAELVKELDVPDKGDPDEKPQQKPGKKPNAGKPPR